MTVRQVFTHYERLAPPGGAFRYCPSCRAELTPVESGGRSRPTCPACGFVQYRNPAPTLSVLISDGERVVLGKRGGLSIPDRYPACCRSQSSLDTR